MDRKPRRLAVFGSTGSIGRQTLEVAQQLGLEVVGLIAGSNHELLMQQISQFRPRWAVMGNGVFGEQKLDGTLLASGADAVQRFSRDHQADIVVAAISGIAGLLPTWNAIQSGASVAIANKESLVTAGHLVMPAAAKQGAVILPVDSEHSALWQCLQGRSITTVSRLTLTASGGPFRDWPKARLQAASLTDALAHPTWSMGNKNTIDSATLMNKGLEVIEAHWLFGMDYDKIDVVVHPQSIVHSLVEFVDGSVLAQMSPPDMRLPIQVALTYPDRAIGVWPRLDLTQVGQLSFQLPRFDDFPCLQLAINAGRCGQSYPIVLNAANEIAVEAFQRGRLSFLGISRLVAAMLDQHQPQLADSIAAVLEIDQAARATAARLLVHLS